MSTQRIPLDGRKHFHVDYITDTLQPKVVSVYATATSSDPELEAAGVHDNGTMVIEDEYGYVAASVYEKQFKKSKYHT